MLGLLSPSLPTVGTTRESCLWGLEWLDKDANSLGRGDGLMNWRLCRPRFCLPPILCAGINTHESMGIKRNSKHGEIPVYKFALCPSLAVMSWLSQCRGSYQKESCSEHLQISLCMNIGIHSPGYILRTGQTGSHGRCMFNFVRYCQSNWFPKWFSHVLFPPAGYKLPASLYLCKHLVWSVLKF